MIQTADTLPQTPDIGVPENITSGSFWHDLKGLGFDDAISKIANGLISFGFKLVIAILVASESLGTRKVIDSLMHRLDGSRAYRTRHIADVHAYEVGQRIL